MSFRRPDETALPPGMPTFVPRFPWIGADLQTLRNFLARPKHDLDAWPARRLELDLADGSGDRLVAALHGAGANAERQPVVLIHGLAGCEDSTYIRASARHLLAAGHPVLRLNLRGAGPARPLCQGQYHAGRSEDLIATLRALAVSDAADFKAGLFLCGYSLGANMLLKCLGELGRCGSAELPKILAAVAVSAPLDLKASQVAIMRPRNAAYQAYLLRRMRAECLASPLPPPADEAARVASVRTLYEFDERIVAPRNGFDSAEHYYAVNSALSFLPAIATPTLVVHALDDPWIPAAPYLRHDWLGNPALHPVLSPSGGHVGFHGHGSHTAWHDRLMLSFFRRQEEGEGTVASPEKVSRAAGSPLPPRPRR